MAYELNSKEFFNAFKKPTIDWHKMPGLWQLLYSTATDLPDVPFQKHGNCQFFWKGRMVAYTVIFVPPVKMAGWL